MQAQATHELRRFPIRTLAYGPGGETRAPRLGEQTDVILAELGLSPEVIAALRRDGVV